MQEKGLAASYGFRYDGDGLLNDHEALWKTMQEGGCALCNLRVGHIVTLIAAREQNGERQLLAMDCHSESGDERVRDHVIEVVETSAVVSPITNQRGLVTGYQVNYGLFWVPLSLPRDFNLLHPAEPRKRRKPHAERSRCPRPEGRQNRRPRRLSSAPLLP